MARRLPPLNALRAFEAAARHLSFARAAEELHVTPAAISQQVRLLEEYLGMPLFKRGKKLGLTDAADAARVLVTDAFDQLERAMLKARADTTGNTLVVSTPPTFAARWLVPRLDDFHAKHPAIELRLLATRRLVDFRTEDVDVAVRFGDGNHPGLVADRLMSESLIPVARRDLAAKIKKPADLVKCTLLEDDWHTENRAFPDWTTWLATLGVESREGFHIHYFGEHNLVIQAALTGLGAALTFKSLVDDDLKAGRLVQLLNHSIPSNLAYHLVMPKPHGDYNKVIAFRSWLLEQCGSFATN